MTIRSISQTTHPEEPTIPSAHSFQETSLSETVGQFCIWCLYRSSGRESPTIVQNLLSLQTLIDHNLLSERDENRLKKGLGKLWDRLRNNEIKFAGLEKEVQRLSDLEKLKHKIVFVAQKLLKEVQKFLPPHQREEWPIQQINHVITKVKEERAPCQEQRQLQELKHCLEKVQTAPECGPHLIDRIQKAVQDSHSSSPSSPSNSEI